MKKISNISRIVILLAIIIVVAGVVMVVIKGYNFSLDYKEHSRIEIYIGKQFETKDIKEITNQVLGNKQVSIKKVEVFNQSVAIEVEELSEEEYKTVTEKIKEKYNIEEENFAIKTEVKNVRGRDIIKPYIAPYISATILAIIYFVIRFRKQGVVKIILASLISLIGMQAVYFSIIAITRIPVGIMFMPVALMIYMLTLLGLIMYLKSERLENRKEDSNK